MFNSRNFPGNVRNSSRYVPEESCEMNYDSFHSRKPTLLIDILLLFLAIAESRLSGAREETEIFRECSGKYIHLQNQ